MAKVMTTSRLSRFQACYTVGLRVRLVTDQQTEEDCRAYMSKNYLFQTSLFGWTKCTHASDQFLNLDHRICP